MLSVEDIRNDESLFTYEDVTGELKTYRLLPNMMFLRKCKKNDVEYLVGEPTKESRIADGILAELTERPEMENADGWCQVLAVGPKREYTKEERKRFNIPKGYHCPAKRGDIVCLPDTSIHGRHWRYAITGKPYDVIAAEWEIFLMW